MKDNVSKLKNLCKLKEEVNIPIENSEHIRPYLYYMGYIESLDMPNTITRAYGIKSLFQNHKKHIYDNDLIAGSIRGLMAPKGEINPNLMNKANSLFSSYGSNHFGTNADHFAPAYRTFLADGINGTLDKISKSRAQIADDKTLDESEAQKRLNFLSATQTVMVAFSQMIRDYGKAALLKSSCVTDKSQKTNLEEIHRVCEKIALDKPETFHQALQLIWFAHTAFLYEGRYAMALGRLDQYLFPYYENDIKSGILTEERALSLLECTLYKIGEYRLIAGGDDVVNIAIAGRKPDGSGGLNKVTWLILEAVKNCNIPGPNLSARLYDGIEDEFLDACLKVIGTGLGYPALMNDEVNIPALNRHGYAIEDCRDYSMVGCIENFITGKQPPWSDGRYNSPKYIELAINNGVCLQSGMQMGPKTGDPKTFDTLDKFLNALEKQMDYGASEYMAFFRNENDRYNKTNYTQPFLSCFCDSCIERGLDINDGGALYPSVHGAGCMGIATMADSLAAIEKVIYTNKKVNLETLRNALAADYQGYDELRAELLNAPKYGNNIDDVDKFACWFVDIHEKIFSKHKTRDGGAIYTAIASNVSNIDAGRYVAATPDGRKNGEPVSEAASPTHGADLNGPTSVVNSTSKPDYTKVSCGTVLNQKFSPEMFRTDEKITKLRALIKTYFKKGGQEMQINSVSRKVLREAIDNPEKYKNLVVRVSGFSAYYVHLPREVQEDILERTEHE